MERRPWIVAGVFALVCLALVTLGYFDMMDAMRRMIDDAEREQSIHEALESASAPVRLEAVSPRHLSNQTSYPITIYGSGLRPGLSLELRALELRARTGSAAGAGVAGDVTSGGDPGARAAVVVPTTHVDDTHLTAMLPAGLEVDRHRALGRFEARLVDEEGRAVGEGRAEVTVVNDVDYPVLHDLEVDERRGHLYVASSTDDAIYRIARESGERTRIEVGDGPRALALWRGAGDGAESGESGGRDWLVVAHEYDEAALWLLPLEEGAERRTIELSAPGGAREVAIDASTHRAYVTNRVSDAVHVVDLVSGEEIGRLEAGVNPREVAVAPGGELIFAGNIGSSDVSILSSDGTRHDRVVPEPGVSIVGGHTEPFAGWVMGGKAARDLVYDADRGVVYVSGIGPNIGPNPRRMEVSMNGGVGVIDVATGRFVRHVSMLHGVPEQMALDARRGLLYVTDVSTGRVVVFDAEALAGDDDSARGALVGSASLSPPEDVHLVRPRGDFGVEGRSGVSLHTGPRAIRLSEDGRRAWVLERLTGDVRELDLEGASRGVLAVERRWRAAQLDAQVQRRQGEVLYFTDMGDTRMSCDACHLEGHSEGLLFTKGEPMHIYRVPTIRSARESAPYFTPAMFPTLEVTAEQVLGRNRFHNPDPSGLEIRALGLYQETLTVPPNPYRVASRGALPDSRAVGGDGTRRGSERRGSPRRGMAVFEGVGGCTACHPAPQFTTDQSAETRGRRHDVGTPVTLDLRRSMQDDAPYPLPPPSLAGAWDNYPMLHSGAAGFSVREDGTARADEREALQRVLEMGATSGEHGSMSELDAGQIDDLLAYLLTL